MWVLYVSLVYVCVCAVFLFIQGIIDVLVSYFVTLFDVTECYLQQK